MVTAGAAGSHPVLSRLFEFPRYRVVLPGADWYRPVTVKGMGLQSALDIAATLCGTVDESMVMVTRDGSEVLGPWRRVFG